MSNVPQGSTLGAVLFSIFIGDLDDLTKYTLWRFVDGGTSGGAVAAELQGPRETSDLSQQKLREVQSCAPGVG